AFDPLQEEIRCDPPYFLGRLRDRGQSRPRHGRERGVIKTGEQDVVRHRKAQLLKGAQRADGSEIVVSEKGADRRPPGLLEKLLGAKVRFVGRLFVPGAALDDPLIAKGDPRVEERCPKSCQLGVATGAEKRYVDVSQIEEVTGDEASTLAMVDRDAGKPVDLLGQDNRGDLHRLQTLEVRRLGIHGHQEHSFNPVSVQPLDAAPFMLVDPARLYEYHTADVPVAI